MTIDQNNPAEKFSRPNDSAKIHDLEQFTLWADTPDRPGFRARLSFGERNGAPRITVFTNYEERPNILFAGMTPVAFWMFLDSFEELVKQPGKARLFIENTDYAPNANKKSDNPEMVVRNKLMYGKSEEGVCWLAMEQQGVKTIYFKLLPSIWHHFCKADGTRITPAEASVAHTLAFIKTLRSAYTGWIGRIKPPFDKTKSPNKGGAGGSTGMTSISTFNNDDLDY